jgi:hypothetical protein
MCYELVASNKYFVDLASVWAYSIIDALDILILEILLTPKIGTRGHWHVGRDWQESTIRQELPSTHSVKGVCGRECVIIRQRVVPQLKAETVTTPPEIIPYYRLNHSIWSSSDNKEASRWVLPGLHPVNHLGTQRGSNECIKTPTKVSPECLTP